MGQLKHFNCWRPTKAMVPLLTCHLNTSGPALSALWAMSGARQMVCWKSKQSGIVRICDVFVDLWQHTCALLLLTARLAASGLVLQQMGLRMSWERVNTLRAAQSEQNKGQGLPYRSCQALTHNTSHANSFPWLGNRFDHGFG